MKAKISPLNNYEPVKDEPCSEPVPEATEIKTEDKDFSHGTWEKPTKDELRQLNAAMAWKFIRLLLQSLAIFGSVSLMIWLRKTDLNPYVAAGIIITGSVILVLYYLEYRAPLIFGERYDPSIDFKEKSLSGFGFGFCGLLLLPFFFLAANFMGIVSYILAAVMAVSTYWKEHFMLMLFVFRKYTVKDGEVTWNKHFREYYRSADYGGKQWDWTSLTYTLDFYDGAERYIPVLVDHYTYRRFKKNGKAILINYQYGDSYMFELVRLKEPVKK